MCSLICACVLCCRWMQRGTAWHGMAWHDMTECRCRMQNADCSAQRDVPGCREREKDSQGQGRDRKKEGVPSPASTSIAIPGRRSRSRRQMRIWKYAMLQTRVDGEAVQQPSGLPGRRSLGLGVDATGETAGRPRCKCRCRRQAQVQAQVQVQVWCRKCTCMCSLVGRGVD